MKLSTHQHYFIAVSWFKQSIGWWWFRFGKLTISFYSSGNGYFKINGKNIKLTKSTNKALPAAQGFYWFKWGSFIFYVRFYKNVFYVYQFGKGGKKVYNGAKGYFGSAKINKGKRKLALSYFSSIFE